MIDYRFACQQDDQSWVEHLFSSSNDNLAILYGLSKRTNSRCQLFHDKRLIATYDGFVVLTGSVDRAKQTSSPIVLTTPLGTKPCEQSSLKKTAARSTDIIVKGLSHAQRASDQLAGKRARIASAFDHRHRRP